MPVLIYSLCLSLLLLQEAAAAAAPEGAAAAPEVAASADAVDGSAADGAVGDKRTEVGASNTRHEQHKRVIAGTTAVA
jgi:hypothetical protein